MTLIAATLTLILMAIWIGAYRISRESIKQRRPEISKIERSICFVAIPFVLGVASFLPIETLSNMVASDDEKTDKQ